MTNSTASREICTNNDVLIVADEIHADLTMPGFDFIAFGKLERALRENAIICTAPSKAFNLAGLQASSMVITEALRERCAQFVVAQLPVAPFTRMFTLNPFGLAAVRAAYDDSEDWLDAALSYINDNLDRLERIRIRTFAGDVIGQALVSCLVGLPLRNDADLGTLFMDKAKLYLDEGHIFGPEGSMRLNVACPRSILDTALERLRQAISDLTMG